MKNLIKTNYKLFLGIFIGIIISGVTVYAINANEISYNGNTLDTTLDELYTKASTYKKLDTETTVLSNNLLKDITAYDNNGNLITGTVSTTCVSGVYTKLANSQINITLDFEPTVYQMIYQNTGGIKFISHDDRFDNNVYYAVAAQNNPAANPSFTATSTGIVSSFASTNSANYKETYDVYYIACR